MQLELVRQALYGLQLDHALHEILLVVGGIDQCLHLNFRCLRGGHIQLALLAILGGHDADVAAAQVLRDLWIRCAYLDILIQLLLHIV